MKLMRIGVDLAKNVFQIHGVDCHELPIWRQRLPRDRWLQTVLEKIEPGCRHGKLWRCTPLGAATTSTRISGDLRALDERVGQLDSEISAIAASEPTAIRLQQLRGVGPMIATALIAAIGDARQFANGRSVCELRAKQGRHQKVETHEAA